MTADTSAEKRGRRRRALAQQLDESLLGPDESRIVQQWDDGWTVRAVTRLSDQRREGILARHCLRALVTPLADVFSLRDLDNLPHVTFSAWRLRESADERMLRGLATDQRIVFRREHVFVVTLLHPGGTNHLERVYEFADARTFKQLPAGPLAALLLLARYTLPQNRSAWARPSPDYVDLLRRIESENHLGLTIWRVRA
jgi:hypothetical protein